MSESGDYSLWNQILQGQPSFGSSGFDIMNSLAQAQTGGYVDPRLAQYYNMTPRESGGYNFTPIEGSGISGTGFIERNGQHLVQTGGVPDDERILNRDPSQFQVDPRFGLVTDHSNVNVPSSFLDRWAPLFVGAGLAGPAMFAAMGGGSAGVALAGDESAGLSMANPFTSGASGFAENSPYWGMQAGGNGVASDANILDGYAGGSEVDGYMGGLGNQPAMSNWATQGAGAGGLDPETLSGAGGMGVSQNGIGPGSLMDRLSGAFNNPSSLLSGNGMLANAGNGLLSSALHNPLQALGAAQMLGGLIHPNNSGSRSSASSKPQGGTGVPQAGSYQRVPWTPNPYTAMQLNQMYGSTLGGH